MEDHMTSGLEELEQVEKVRPIPTLSMSVDSILNGGIRPRTLTEVVGLPGVGKTTLCLQLCLNVQIPSMLQGNAGEAVYIGTNHSLSSCRLSQMAGGFVRRCNSIINTESSLPEGEKIGQQLSVDEVLSKIHVVKCCHIQDLVKIIISLGNFLKKNDQVRLVVIDDIAFPMFTDSDTFSTRVKVLYSLSRDLYTCLVKYNVAVVIVNCLMTRFRTGANNEKVEFYVPFLGEAWGYVSSQTLELSQSHGGKKRNAKLLKSAFTSVGTVGNYRIIHDGFRD